MAAKERSLADAICEAVYEYDNSLILLGLSGSMLLEAAKAKGLPYASEVFADRAYEEDGSLVARTKEGAVIKDEDEAVNRVIRMVTQGTVEAITGKVVPIKADSVCVHGDNEKALAFVMKIRASLESSGVKISALER
jgi:UPF0271 protein